MKKLTGIYWLLGFILFGVILIETQNLSLVYNSEKECTDRIEKLKEWYSDYGWYKEKYNELTEKNRGTYVVTYGIQEGQDYIYTVRRTITCYNSLMPTMDWDTLHIVWCGQFEWVNGVNFIKK